MTKRVEGDGRRFYVIRDGKLVEVFRAPPSDPVAPAIITDTMPATFHPADGSFCDSKSRFKQITRAHGFDDRTGAKAVANNQPKLKEVTTEHYERDVKIAYEMCKAGTAPLSEHDKAMCKRIDERIKNKV